MNQKQNCVVTTHTAHIHLSFSPSLRASLHDQSDLLIHSLAVGLDPSSTAPRICQTPLVATATFGLGPIVQVLLRALSVMNLISQPDLMAALTWASLNGHECVVRALLAAKTDPNLDPRLFWGMSPLYLAASAGQVDVVSALLQARAEVDSHNLGSVTPLYVASQSGQACVVRKLAEANANVNHAIMGTGDTPLCAACDMGHYDVVQTLLECQAMVNQAEGLHGWSPLMMAIMNGFSDIVQLLIEHRVNVDYPTKCERQLTPLTLASKHGFLDIVKALVGAGANVNLTRKNYGQTPLFRC